MKFRLVTATTALHRVCLSTTAGAVTIAEIITEAPLVVASCRSSRDVIYRSFLTVERINADAFSETTAVCLGRVCVC